MCYAFDRDRVSERHEHAGRAKSFKSFTGSVVLLALRQLPLFCLGLGALLLWNAASHAKDWPQWGSQTGRNMVADEPGLPASFVPGKRNAEGPGIDLATTTNVKWAARLGTMTCSTPVVAGGRVFIGTARDEQGLLLCLDERTGNQLWHWTAPARTVPATIDGHKLWFGHFPRQLGVCSSPAVDEDRVYVVTHRCEVACFDARGRTRGDEAGNAEILWLFDMWEFGVRPSDACDCSVLIQGDFVYVCTSNGVDRDADARAHGEVRKPPAPTAPNLIVLDKQTGRLVAQDEAPIAKQLLHGQWSSPSLGHVGDKPLVFFGGGDGVCYAFEALTAAAAQPVILKTAWSFDCNPPEYKVFGNLDLITHYCLGDRRRSDSLNRTDDGSFVGMSEIIATPVFYKNRVYIAIGRDPEHGRGRGALWCLDAAQRGDITATGKIWGYQGLDRTLSTVSIADGLLYIADVAGRLHCLDAETGQLYWVHETKAKVWGSTLVADGKVYLPTEKKLWVLAAGKQAQVLDTISLGAPIWSSPIAANGVLYIASKQYLWAVHTPP